jgi:four helix bundle protein
MAAHDEQGTRIRSYRDLIAWQKAMALAEEVYNATRDYPKDEMYGLRAQMRRAAVSVASNVAEGHARSTPGEFVQFLGHAKGSLAELETQIILSARLGFLSADFGPRIADAIAEVGRLLNGLRNSLR